MEYENTPLTKRTVYALLSGLNQQPNADVSTVVNRFMAAGWQIIELLHQEAAVRACTPRRWPLGIIRGPKTRPVVVKDDPYACPGQYVEDLAKSDALDQAIVTLSAGKPVEKEVRPLQSISCQFEIEASNVAAYQAYGAFYDRTAAINRLIQTGFLRLHIESQGSWLEYQFSGAQSWTRLPPA
jgi:hypothetical protein